MIEGVVVGVNGFDGVGDRRRRVGVGVNLVVGAGVEVGPWVGVDDGPVVGSLVGVIDIVGEGCSVGVTVASWALVIPDWTNMKYVTNNDMKNKL